MRYALALATQTSLAPARCGETDRSSGSGVASIGGADRAPFALPAGARKPHHASTVTLPTARA